MPQRNQEGELYHYPPPDRGPNRGAKRDDSQLPSRHPPGFGRSAGPPDCDSRIPDYRIRPRPDSQRTLRPKGAARSSPQSWRGAGRELIIDVVRILCLGPPRAGQACGAGGYASRSAGR